MDGSNGKMEYIKEYKIHLLFEQLAASLLSNRPSQPVTFLIEQLQQLQVSCGSVPTPIATKTALTASLLPQSASSSLMTSAVIAQPTDSHSLLQPNMSSEVKAMPLKVTLAVFGLDAAGKSTLISALAGEVDRNCPPTVGFSPNTFRSENWDLTMFDLGGGSKFRGIWKEYFSELHGIVFVIDSADAGRFSEAKDALWGVLNDPRAQGKPLLIFANKQDVSSSKSATEIEAVLHVKDLPRHHVFGCSAIADPVDENIEKGVEWLLEEVTGSFDALSSRIKLQLAEDKQRRKEAMVEQQKRVAEYRKVWEAEDQQQEKAAK